MRVLLVNKYFHPRAGAETSALGTRRLLLDHGHEVMDFAMRHPDNLPSPDEAHFAPERSYESGGGGRARRVIDAAASIYSPAARRALAGLLDERRPDVAHLHNIYHQLTTSIVDELAAREIPIVLTLHDWKIACPSYTLFTDGARCRRCPRGTVMSAVRHRCVKGSLPASALAAAEAAVVHRRGTYGQVTRFISPSRFGVEVAGLAGIPAERCHFLANFLPDRELDGAPEHVEAGPRLLYVGRLDHTKGVGQLLEAFARIEDPEATLRVAGMGEMAGDVQEAAARDDRIEFLGRIPRSQVYEELSTARAVVMPSIWEENGPFVQLEAQACGAPMVVTDRGGPGEFVEHGVSGLVVDPTNIDALAGAMRELVEDPARARALGSAARERVDSEHRESRHHEQLTTIYKEAMATTRNDEP